jgi:hypothetical protein
MMFSFPKKQLEDKCWFLSEEDDLKFGTVRMISITIKEGDCSVWYTVVVAGRDYLVQEQQVMDNDTKLPMPKWHVGDEISYSYRNKKTKQTQYDTGIIETIEVHSKGREVNIYYSTQEDPDYYIAEDDILAFAEETGDDVYMGDR